jgi:integrase/recombinase XerD
MTASHMQAIATGADAPATDHDLTRIAAAVAALPALPAALRGQRYGPKQNTVSWLLAKTSAHTRRAYFGDLSDYLAWCDGHRLDPLTARRADLDLYASQLRSRYSASVRTVARKLAAISSWYAYLLQNSTADEAHAPAGNPASAVKRPSLARLKSPTAGLTPGQVAALEYWADREVDVRRDVYAANPSVGRAQRYLAAARDRALIRLLSSLGLRVGEAIALDLASLSYNRGHRTIRYTGKGNRPRERALDASVLEALDDYLRLRATVTGARITEMTGPLFATNVPGPAGRLSEPTVHRLVRRLARHAGIPTDRLSPHSLRHAYATTAREEGAPLEDVQDSMDHADTRTTRGYDRDRYNLDRDPARLVGARYARDRHRYIQDQTAPAD